MRLNRITFSKLKTQWDILKMRSAYILAERSIIESTNKGVDITGSDRMSEMGPQEFFEFESQVFGSKTKREEIIAQMQALEDQGRILLDEEKYESLELIKKAWEILNNKLNRL